MAIWLVRAGSQGEYAQKFIQEKRSYDDNYFFGIPHEADLHAARGAIR